MKEFVVLALLAQAVPGADPCAAGRRLELSEPFRFESIRGGPSRILADLDGNGRLDLITVQGAAVFPLLPGGLAIHFNDGEDGFRSVTTPLPLPMGEIVLAAADLDGDRDLDLVVASGSSRETSILINGGDGRIEEQRPLGTWTPVTGVATGDLDGDGRVDLITTGPSLWSTWRNQGGARFTTQSPGHSEGTFVAPVLVDLDGDGDLDLAMGENGATNRVQILENRAGELLPRSSFLRSAPTYRLLPGDLEGDGDLDILAASRSASEITVLRNDGSGSFSGAASILLETAPTQIEAADLDLDGDVDLATASEDGTVRLLLDRGDGTFEPGLEMSGTDLGRSLTVGDMDADGDPDLVLDGLFFGLQIVINRPSFPPELDCDQNGRSDRCEVAEGTALDCDGNGLPDACDLAPRMRLHAGQELVVENARTAGLGDLDRDGDLDAAFALHDGSIELRWNEGERVFRRGESLQTVPGAGRLLVEDMDGDGHPELIAAGQSVFVHWNGGDGTFRSPVQASSRREAQRLQAGDIDGDGDLDLALAGESTTEAGLFLARNLGGRTFEDGLRIFASGRISPAFLDLEGDGDLDLAAGAGITVNGLHLLRNSGDGTFSLSPSIRVEGAVNAVLSLDVDGDGSPDVVAAREDTPLLVVLRNDGQGQLVDPRFHPVTAAADSLAAGDLDGDGLAEVITGSGDVLPARGGGDFGPPIAFAFRGAWPAVGDLDGDARADILLADPENGSIHWNEGRLRMGPRRHPESASAMVEMDLEGDGDFDLVTARSGRISLLRNASGDLGPPARMVFEEERHFETLVPGDVDGDGDLDLSVLTVLGDVDLLTLRNDGAGRFGSSSTLRLARLPRSMAALDLEGDGDLDLATIIPFRLDLHPNDGSGVFDRGESIPVGSDPMHVAAAELDGDGRDDLVTANALGNLSILLNDVRGGFTVPRNFGAGGTPSTLVVADLDGDGRADLANGIQARFPDPSSLGMLWNSGGGSFSTVFPLPLGGNFPTALAAADLDGDGDVDLASPDIPSGKLRVIPNRGGRTLGPVLDVPFFGSHLLEVVDLDGDGLPELIAASSDDLLVIPNVALPPRATDCDQDGVPDPCQRPAPACEDSPFIRGDADGSGGLDVTDPIAILSTLFRGADLLRCLDAADADDDGALTITDPIALLAHLFQGGAPPPAPFPACGVDPRGDGPGCEESAACPRS